MNPLCVPSFSLIRVYMHSHFMAENTNHAKNKELLHYRVS